MSTAVVLLSNREEREFPVKDLKDLKKIQEAVGGYFEMVMCQNKMCLLVDDEGLLKKKPYNETASSYTNDRPEIFGDAIYCPQKLVS